MIADDGWRLLAADPPEGHGWCWRVIAFGEDQTKPIIFAVSRLGLVRRVDIQANATIVRTAVDRLVHIDDLVPCAAPSLHRAEWQCGVCQLCGGAGRS